MFSFRRLEQYHSSRQITKSVCCLLISVKKNQCQGLFALALVCSRFRQLYPPPSFECCPTKNSCVWRPVEKGCNTVLNIPSKSMVKSRKIFFFVSVLKVNDENSRIRIHQSWIRNTGSKIVLIPKDQTIIIVSFSPVLIVTAIKDLFEDRRRYKSDKRVNNSCCRVFRQAQQQQLNELSSVFFASEFGSDLFCHNYRCLVIFSFKLA